MFPGRTERNYRPDTFPKHCLSTFDCMILVLLRIRLPDRPGALGAVASRIGAVGGDIVSVEIVSRGVESACDEFIIELGSEDLMTLLLHEIYEVDGVDVDEIRPLLPPESLPDGAINPMPWNG